MDENPINNTSSKPLSFADLEKLGYENWVIETRKLDKALVSKDEFKNRWLVTLGAAAKEDMKTAEYDSMPSVFFELLYQMMRGYPHLFEEDTNPETTIIRTYHFDPSRDKMSPLQLQATVIFAKDSELTKEEKTMVRIAEILTIDFEDRLGTKHDGFADIIKRKNPRLSEMQIEVAWVMENSHRQQRKLAKKREARESQGNEMEGSRVGGVDESRNPRDQPMDTMEDVVLNDSDGIKKVYEKESATSNRQEHAASIPTQSTIKLQSPSILQNDSHETEKESTDSSIVVLSKPMDKVTPMSFVLPVREKRKRENDEPEEAINSETGGSENEGVEPPAKRVYARKISYYFKKTAEQGKRERRKARTMAEEVFEQKVAREEMDEGEMAEMAEMENI